MVVYCASVGVRLFLLVKGAKVTCIVVENICIHSKVFLVLNVVFSGHYRYIIGTFIKCELGML